MLVQSNNISPCLLEFVNPQSQQYEMEKKPLPLCFAVKGSTLIKKNKNKTKLIHFNRKTQYFFFKQDNIKYQLRKTGTRVPTKSTVKGTIYWLRLEGSSGDCLVKVPARRWVNYERMAWDPVQSCLMYLQPGPVLNHLTVFYYYI